MTLFQLLLLGMTAFFAYQVYKHINTLEDKPTTPKPFDDGGIKKDIEEFSPKTIYTVAELIEQADEAYQKGELDKALMILREANYNKPYDAEILYKIAFIHYKKEAYQDAIEALEDALKGDENDPSIYALMASCYRALKQYAKARENIEKALSLESDNAIYHFNYANILQDMGHIDEAIAEYEKAIALNATLEAAQEELEKLKREQDETA
jgi:tetratricopeptide (TPR) repeat protein